MRTYIAERAISPDDGSVSWVVVSDDYELHPQATAYLASLQSRDCSTNTQRVYAGRVALYLTRCAATGVDWAAPSFVWLTRFLHWLVEEPLPPRGRKAGPEPRFREKTTANQIVTTVGEFLRFGVPNGWVTPETAAMLSEQKYLSFLPPGYSAGEDGQHRIVDTKTVKFNVAVPGYEWLNDKQFEQLVNATTRARDRFLVSLLGATGTRIGEALGLHRQDMHLLSNSASLGCQVLGPHIHVRRRLNSNGALAKSRKPRWIPVEDELVGLYAEYAHERAMVPEAAESEMVFVNLFRNPLGKPMGYSNAKDLFDRLAAKVGFAARPHMLRHTAATRWVRNGTPRDVVQELMGHVSPSSMDPYVHATDADKRAAVERLAAKRRQEASA
ncbi:MULTISPECIES: tyrosine-type recombinase/integrase [unclassified Streptomyces]|uniref:tyrosine-type recombinase/integrase n=1 Tax=unclassified Streptomyces TaxID=2593676 RepID=UPI000B821A28|nr:MULTISPECIES: tyrosine-type recombinase/integrase [unclassified Streptomyces]